MTLRRLALFILALLLAALLFVAFGPVLYGPALITRLGLAYQVSVESVSGPLWNFTAHHLSAKGAGLNIKADEAHLSVAALNPLDKTARLNVALSGGTVDVTLKDLLKQFKGSKTNRASGGFSILPGNLEINDVQVKLNGKGVDIPNGQFSVSGGSTSPTSGQIKVTGQTAYGDANAALRYTEQNGTFSATADFDADARIINAYWKPGGVTAGRVTGQYRLGSGLLQGDFKLSGGALRVPQAKFVTVSEIGGRFTQRGDLIQGQVSGAGLGGPINAQARVDLAAKHWQVSGQASPTLTALGKALKVPASGAARLTVQAGGWQQTAVSVRLSSTSGQFADIPYQALGAVYSFEFGHKRIIKNTLSVQATTKLLSETQHLWGEWAFNRSGTVYLAGQLAKKPLSLKGQIDAENTLTVQGDGLGGPVQASYQLKSEVLSASLKPNIYNLTGELSANGKVSDLALEARRIKVGPLTLSGSGTLDKSGLQASLLEQAGGTASLITNRNFVGSWTLDGLSYAGVKASGNGNINLTSGLSGQLSATVPSVTNDLSGPITLNWKDRTGLWQAGQQRLTWNADTFGLTANTLNAAGVTLSGQAAYRTDTRRVSVQASTALLGEAQQITGNWAAGQTGQFKVAGRLLNQPLSVTAQLDVHNTLSLQGQAVGGPVQASFQPTTQQIKAQLQPTLSGVTGQLSVQGTPQNLAVTAQQVKAGPLTLSGSGHWNGTSLQATLNEAGGGVLTATGQPNDLKVTAKNFGVGPLTLSGSGTLDKSGLQASLLEQAGGTASLTTNRNFVGSWTLDGLSYAGVKASGNGNINLTSGLSGQLSATVPSVTNDLSGPITLNWKDRTGLWQAGQQRLTWNADTFGLTANTLNAAGVTLSGQAAYRTDTRRVSVQASTALLGEAQQITGNWTVGQTGQFKVAGRLLNQPLSVTAQLDAHNSLTLQGQAVGGPVQARYQPDTQQVKAQLQPTLSGVTGQLSVQGTPQNLAVTAQQVKAGPLTLSGSGRWNGTSLQASLTESGGGVLTATGQPNNLRVTAKNFGVGPLTLSGQGTLTNAGLNVSLLEQAGGTASLTTNRNFVGTWTLNGLSYAGVKASGNGQINLTSGLSGQLSATVPSVTNDLSGPITLNWKDRTGLWQAGQQRLTWNAETFGLTANTLNAAGVTLSGQAAYRTDTQRVSVQASTALLGETQQITGNWTAGQTGQFKIAGRLFNEPLSVTAQLDARNTLSLQGQAVGGPVQASFQPATQQIQAQLQPTLSGVTGQLSVQGTPQNLAVTAQQVKAGPLTLSGSGRWNGTSLQASLTESGGGVLTATGQPNDLRVTAKNFGVGPLTLSGQGKLDRNGLQATLNEVNGGVLSVKGPLNDLTVTARNFGVGPLTLSGQGTLDNSGLRASLREQGGGVVSLTTNPDFTGTWKLDGLSYLGVKASGNGNINLTSGLSGQLSATVPSVTSDLSGPITLNWKDRTGLWQAGQQRLTWNAETFSLTANALKVQDFSVNGQAAYRISDRQVTGRLSASGNGVDVVATAQGQQAQLSGSLRGVSIQATTNLNSPFTTQASVKGADISGTLSIQNGVTFQLKTGTQTAQGTLNGQNWDVTGGVDLSALRPLLGSNPPALSGSAQLNLKGRGGTAALQASFEGAAVKGTLTRQGGTVSANLTGQLSDLSAALNGQVYPQVQLSGPVTWHGAGGPQTALAQISGPYSALRVQANGQTTAVQTGSVALPAQPLRLQGNLTPTLALSGAWGDLGLTYREGEIAVKGQQTLSAAGQTGQVQVDATWQPDYSGQLLASGQLGEYRFKASGPWTALDVTLNGAGLQASGRANARTRQYALDVAGQVSGLTVSGAVHGQNAEISGTLKAEDGQGGQADIQVNSLSDFAVNIRNFKVAGQTLQGNLKAVDGLISGTAQLGPLNVTAQGGRFTASGTLYQHTVQASGQLKLPSTLSDLKVKVDGPYLSAQASGSGAALRGNVQFKAQQYRVAAGSGHLSALLPAQVLPLSASLSPLSVTVGGLTYAGGTWSGGAALHYALAGRANSLKLLGNGQTLSAQPQGVVSGQVTLLPSIGGEIKLDLSALLATVPQLLPAQVKAHLVPGVLSAQLSPQSAAIGLSGGRWLGEVLKLDGNVNWASGLTAEGLRADALLSLPTSRLPLSYDGQDLRLSNAVLDARDLKPFTETLGELSGQIRADVRLPKLQVADASGQADVKLSLGQQAAQGQLRLSGGQFSGQLSSDLGGQALSLSGDLYPRAEATFAYGDVRGTLSGDARIVATNPAETAGVWTAQASGSVQGRPVTARATLSPQAATLSGIVDGLQLDLSAKQSTPTWTVSGTFDSADLRPLTGQVGQIAGTLSGTLSQLTARASGTLAGVNFTLPARYQGGAVTATAATLNGDLSQFGLDQGKVSASLSGQIYPALQVSGSAALDAYAPGTYQLSASGPYSAVRLTLGGVLKADVLGLGVAGTRLDAVLSGQDFKVEAQGDQLAGVVQGRTDVPNYLQDARLTLHLPYQNGNTQLSVVGPLSWNAKSGWGGGVTVSGQAPGGKLNARVTGNGPLSLSATLGPAQLSGNFSASLPTTPGGSLSLKTFDLGAFWQRPDLLSVSGQASLSGKTWAQLEASFSGQLTDAGGQLSGALSGGYAAGNVSVNLKGEALQGAASFKGGELNAALSAQEVTLARFLPPSLGVDSLKLSGVVEALGSTSAGLQKLTAHDLTLSGQQRQIGAFKLGGSATYAGGVAEADLRGSAYGGTVTALGNFQDGLRLSARQLDLSAYGFSAASGDLLLRGAYANPTVTGTLNLARPEGAATATLSGYLHRPSLNVTAKLSGEYSGTVHAEAQQIDLTRLDQLGQLADTTPLHLSGSVAQGAQASQQTTLSFDLKGAWPRLSGEASAHLAALPQPISLLGRGDGSYAIDAGTLGSGTLTLTGLNPVLRASATLTPLALLGTTFKGLEGQGALKASLSGPLSNLQLAASGTFRDLALSGVTLPDTSVSLAGPLSAVAGEVQQGGKTVGTLAGQTLTFSGLQALAAGVELSASGTANLNGSAQAQISASGLLSGTALKGAAKVSYSAGALQSSGTLSAAGFAGAFDLSAASKTGWQGNLKVSGGPNLSSLGPVLNAPAVLSVTGPFDAPKLAGTLGLVGAKASLRASLAGAELRLQDGPTLQASGTLKLSQSGGRYIWSGESRLVRPEGELSFSLSGPAADPTAALNFKRGGWTAQGQGNLSGARLTLSDGVHPGELSYDGKVVKVNAQRLDLAKLKIGTLSGEVSAVGSLDSQLSGSVSLSFSNLSSGATLPYFDLPLAGSGRAALKLVKGVGQLQADVTAPYGQVALSAQQPAGGGPWAGSLKGQLEKGAGRVIVDVTLGASGAGGKLTLQDLPLSLSSVNATVNGQVTLSGQGFTLDAEALSGMGRAEISGDGGLADLVPALSNFTVLRPTEAGYRVQVGVSSFDLAQLKLGSGIGGALSGQLTLSDGNGSFVVRSAALKLGDARFPARVDGNLAGGDWRLRGFVGNSTLFGAVTSGQLSVLAQLEALPVGNIIAGFTGKLPGNGVVTGVARIDAPLADLLSGRLNLVAERVRVTAGQDTLIGSGTLDFNNRELRQLNLHLDGAGQWNVAGEFTHQKVDLQAAFTNTTFTPALAFVPSLSDLAPALKGSLTLKVGGSYEQPTASLSGSKLVGSLAGVTVTLPSVQGQLANDGKFTAQTSLQASGAASGSGTLSLSGQLSGSQLSGTVARYQGTLSADALGNLGTLSATLTQAQNSWVVSAAAQQGGTLSLSGQVSPSFDLRLAARQYNLPIRSIYARESSLDGDLTAKSAGEQIVVGGSLSFERLVLGRLNATSLPGTTSTPDPTSASSTYVSPLPDELTVFPSANGEKPVSPFLQRIVFADIPIRAPNGIRVDENLAQAELSAALTLSGSGASPRLSGTVRSLRGNLLLRENNFNLQNAIASFDGSSIYPVFSVTAQGQVPDQSGKQIGVQLQADGSFVVQSGARALKLDTALSCTTCANAAQYSQAELYSLLALGTPDITTLGSNIASLGQSAVSTALNVFVLGELQRNIARALGVDVFRISSNLITPEGNLDAKFTVGTYLSKQFYIQYQVDLTGKGLFDATYTTPDNRFTFKVSTPISGLDLQSVRPSLLVAYNINANNSFTLGVQSGSSTKFSVGYLYKW